MCVINFYTHIHMFHYPILDLKLYVVLLNLHLQSHEMFFIIVLASFLFVIILNTLTFMSFVIFRTHIFGDETLAALQLPLHLSYLFMNGKYLSLTRFKSIRKDLIINGSLFNEIHLLTKDSPEHNKTVKICLIRQSIILYYF